MNLSATWLAAERQRDIERSLRRRAVQLARRAAARCRTRLMGVLPVEVACRSVRACAA